MSMHPTRNYFKDYPNPVYVETGTYMGDSLYLAMQAGFKQVIGIDINQAYIDTCKQRFADNIPRPKLVTGDSATELERAISDIYQPITFWLDSHSQLFEDEPESTNPFPLLQELEQIARHPIKTHTILIDDILILTHPDVTGWTRGAIEHAIYQINPHYKIMYLPNPVKNNILVASI